MGDEMDDQMTDAPRDRSVSGPARVGKWLRRTLRQRQPATIVGMAVVLAVLGFVFGELTFHGAATTDAGSGSSQVTLPPSGIPGLQIGTTPGSGHTASSTTIATSSSASTTTTATTTPANTGTASPPSSSTTVPGGPHPATTTTTVPPTTTTAPSRKHHPPPTTTTSTVPPPTTTIPQPTTTTVPPTTTTECFLICLP
jgi:hypothetical protein